MSRLFARAVRLLKFGAVAGAAVGIGRMVVNRRRRAQEVESSWPTIAEAAAGNGDAIDDEDGDSPESSSDDAARADDEADADNDDDSDKS